MSFLERDTIERRDREREGEGHPYGRESTDECPTQWLDLCDEALERPLRFAVFRMYLRTREKFGRERESEQRLELGWDFGKRGRNGNSRKSFWYFFFWKWVIHIKAQWDFKLLKKMILLEKKLKSWVCLKLYKMATCMLHQILQQLIPIDFLILLSLILVKQT